MNAFEAGIRKIIPATLVYLENNKGELLMLHRNRKEGDFHEGKWNGLGGKLEIDESSFQCASREIAEEAGVVIAPDRFQLIGFLQFPNFKPKKSEDWNCFVFKVRISEEESDCIEYSGPEGDLKWIPYADVPGLNLWPGDLLFIPYVIKGEKFHGTIWYDAAGAVSRHEMIRI